MLAHDGLGQLGADLDHPFAELFDKQLGDPVSGREVVDRLTGRRSIGGTMRCIRSRPLRSAVSIN